MHMNEQSERQIQRCIDDELSPDESRLLLSRLDKIDDGWKTLACGFLEDRLFRKSFVGGTNSRDSDFTSTPKPVTVGSQKLQNQAKGLRHWFNHPLTSLALCTAIAFASGMLIPRSPSAATGSVAEAPRINSTADQIAASPRPAIPESLHADSGKVPRYHVEWTPTGTSAQQPLQIPVYQKVDDLVHELAADRNLFQHDDVSGSENNHRATRLLRIPLNDSEDILLFVRDESYGLPLQ